MSNGFLYYAHNNEEINYLKLAICSALSGHHYVSDFRATLVTDPWAMSTLSKKEKLLLEKCFETIKFQEDFHSFKNDRVVMNGFESKGLHRWWNRTRPRAYEDSDYDQTILVDVDYIFQDNNTELLWNSETPIKLNRDVIPIVRKENERVFLGENDVLVGQFTIPLYWATLVYFDKSEFSKDFFTLVNLIQKNYDFYRRIHKIKGKSYRNDFAFSIALHMSCGFKAPGKEFELPFKYILATQTDKLHEITKKSARFLVNTRDWKSPWNYLTLEGISYHCMNKVSLLLQYDNFLKHYGGDL